MMATAAAEATTAPAPSVSINCIPYHESLLSHHIIVSWLPHKKPAGVQWLQDGWVRVFDTSTQQLLHSTQLDPDSAVASITLGPAAGGLLFAAAGQTVHALDTRATLSPCFTLQGNSDEVGCVAVNQQGSYLAAADDAGDVFVFDLAKRAVFKAIGGAHSNIASGVCFRPHRPWELITGGLDSRVVKCDFSRGKVLQVRFVAKSCCWRLCLATAVCSIAPIAYATCI